jgi:hypothetical protein
MLPVALYTEHAGPGRVPGRQRAPIWSLSDLPGLEARSELPEVQEFLRDAIRQGKIRVLPNPGSSSKVRIIRIAPGGAPRDLRQS